MYIHTCIDTHNVYDIYLDEMVNTNTAIRSLCGNLAVLLCNLKIQMIT